MSIVIDDFYSNGNIPPVSEVISAIEADVERNVFFIHFTENAIQDERLRRMKIGIVAFTFIPQGYPLVPFNRPAAKYIETTAAYAPETLWDFVSDGSFGEDGVGVYTFQSPIVMNNRGDENRIILRIFIDDDRYTTYHNIEGNLGSVGTCVIELQ